ncbi:unnamed protein product [Anisakis simplex]|uniref:HemK methyltransferase family member 2 (inferred by orthology to a human protein) n=1 Tax=Anisakis simplex TaxID=6269 RepID=A0A0M3J9T9_ANISI|nr:unnamed protein product [Anisakis simplex]
MSKFKTPLYRMTSQQKETVYDPAEDTFLLLDGLEMDIDRIKHSAFIIEVGCGSGVVSCTETTQQLNNTTKNIDLVQCDLITAISDRFNGLFDLILFNPPYVPTEPEEITTASDIVSLLFITLHIINIHIIIY